MIKKLYEITLSYQELESELLELQGELTTEIEEKLNSLSKDLASKTDSIGYILERLERESIALKEKSKQFQIVAKRLEQAYDRLKDYTKQNMKALDVSELQGESYRFKKSNLKPKLVIDDEALIDRAYFKETILTTLDKEMIRLALENGISVNGARLEEVTSLRITVPRGDK